MKIVIASDSFKGSCTSIEVAESIEKGIKKVFKDSVIIKVPVADGGEGTVDAIVLGTGGRYEKLQVTDPLGRKIVGKIGIIKDNIAVIEMAQASGLTLLKEEDRNPLVTTTYGTGEMIKAAMDMGCKMIYVGLGGSATNDGGAGMAQALGVSFKDKYGNEIGFGGRELSKIHSIDLSGLDERLKDTHITVLSDVTNPLCGANGASYTYGPQKGATPEMVVELDRNLAHYAKVIKEYLGIDIMDVPGAGAAGGLGAGLMAFCNAEMTSGIDKILDIIDIDKAVKDADLVITGEGRIDFQSAYGKVPIGIAKRAKKYGVPVIAFVGSIGERASEVFNHGIDTIFDIITKPMELDEAIKDVKILTEDTAERVMRLIAIYLNKI